MNGWLDWIDVGGGRRGGVRGVSGVGENWREIGGLKTSLI